MSKDQSKKMNFKFRKTAEELRRLLELRRSSASRPVESKKRYKRKPKHPKQDQNY